MLVRRTWFSSHTVKMLTFHHDTKANFSQLQLSFLFPIQLYCQLPRNYDCKSVMSYKLIITLSEISRIWHKSEKLSMPWLFKRWIALSRGRGRSRNFFVRRGGPNFGSERTVELFCGKFLLTQTTMCFSICECWSSLERKILLCEQRWTDHRRVPKSNIIKE